MVTEDKSLSAMIQNDAEKEWMLPLLAFRSKWMDINDPDPEIKKRKIDEERKHRDFRRMNGSLTVFNDRLVHGPYKAYYREDMLRAVLEAQIAVRELGPESVKNLELLSIEDLEEIRRIWVLEKHEIEDRVPVIYKEVMGEPYPIEFTHDEGTFRAGDLALLKEVCADIDDSEVHYEVVRNLLHVEYQHRTMAKRNRYFFGELEKLLAAGAFSKEEEAQAFAITKHNNKEEIINQGVSDTFTDPAFYNLISSVEV